MNKDAQVSSQSRKIAVSWIVFAILVIYTYGLLIAVPYAGFSFNPSNQRVEVVFVDNDPPLQIGDILEKVGDITLEQFKRDRRLVLFTGMTQGDRVDIVVMRDGERRTIQWVFPGFNQKEFLNRLFNSWILAYAFWGTGLAIQLSIRPRDIRRRLFVIANYLMAFFLVFGDLSSRHFWESSTLLHIVTWLLMPVFLHLHWVFPRPLKDISPRFWGTLYGATFLLVLGEAFHAFGRSAYAVGFIIAILGSIAFLVAHFVIQKGERRTIVLLAASILMAFLFSIVSAIAVINGFVLNPGWVTVFSMPFMPLMYFYLIYRLQPAGMEARVNRIITTYAFLILLGVTVFIVIIVAVQLKLVQESGAILAGLLSFSSTLVAVVSLPRFQRFINQRFFGIKLPYQNLPETFSGRIAACDTIPSLLALLEDEVFPTLLVRQYAFLQSKDKTLSLLLAKGIPDESFDFDFLSQKAGRYLPSLSPDEGWLRLILPLKVSDKTLGFWLLGKRDPDDLYPQAEIPILQSLADQTAIALSNILHSDRLREYYRTELDIVGNERNRIARDLHETVLNKLADMRNNLNQKTLPPGFLISYDELKKQLREIISDLRPPLLDQGLLFGVNEMVEDFRDKTEGVTIILDIQSGEGRLPEKVEEHLFHIVHEACENALKHADARTLTISGVVSPERADLSIQDDGKGFDSDARLNALTADRHFGLTHMKERAHLIRAEIGFHSSPNEGTKVSITWRKGG